MHCVLRDENTLTGMGSRGRSAEKEGRQLEIPPLLTGVLIWEYQQRTRSMKKNLALPYDYKLIWRIDKSRGKTIGFVRKKVTMGCVHNLMRDRKIERSTP